jgi:hypothetical protein
MPGAPPVEPGACRAAGHLGGKRRSHPARAANSLIRCAGQRWCAAVGTDAHHAAQRSSLKRSGGDVA